MQSPIKLEAGEGGVGVAHGTEKPPGLKRKRIRPWCVERVQNYSEHALGFEFGLGLGLGYDGIASFSSILVHSEAKTLRFAVNLIFVLKAKKTRG